MDNKTLFQKCRTVGPLPEALLIPMTVFRKQQRSLGHKCEEIKK